MFKSFYSFSSNIWDVFTLDYLKEKFDGEKLFWLLKRIL